MTSEATAVCISIGTFINVIEALDENTQSVTLPLSENNFPILRKTLEKKNFQKPAYGFIYFKA
ncbi:MAG: hypothetical protein WC222_07440 [Parachlamydiales bacterium]|jgi:hypothetical protein